MNKKRLVALMLGLVLLFAIGLGGCATIDDVAESDSGAEKAAADDTPKEDAKEDTAADDTADDGAADTVASGFKGYYTDEKETYYMVTFVNGHPYWVGCYQGALAAAANLGPNIEVKFGGTPEYDINEAVSSFEQIAATQPDGILLACMNPEPFVEAIANCQANGVPVVTYDTDSPNSDRLAYASTDNVYLGKQVFSYIKDKVMKSEEFKIGLMGRPGQLNLEERIAGFKEMAEDYPGIEIVAEVNGEGDIVKATTAATAMIQANPDLDIIWSSDGIGGPGAAQACEELGREDIIVMCVDSSDDVLAMIKAGKIYATVAQNTYNQGYWSMMMLYSYCHDLVDPFTDWKETGASPLPPYINTGIDFLTADNCEAFSVE